MLEKIKTELEKLDIPFEENVSLKKITWIKRGGTASVFCRPRNVLELKELCVFFRKNQICFDIIAGTSNIYCKESYNPLVAISTLKVNKYNFDSDCIECDCGVQSAVVAKKCCEMGFEGLEGLVNLPGTIGGAICNNSSAFGCCISDNLQSVLFVDDRGNVKELEKGVFEFSHRSSALKSKKIIGTILSCKFKKVKSERDLQQIAEHNTVVRKKTQQGPLQNLGSIFVDNNIRRLVRTDFTSIFSYIRYLTFLVWHKFIGRKISFLGSSKKRFILNILGYADIEKYVSEKNFNCFVWLDDNADAAFVRYTEFMNLYNNTSKFEIEIRE